MKKVLLSAFLILGINACFAYSLNGFSERFIRKFQNCEPYIENSAFNKNGTVYRDKKQIAVGWGFYPNVIFVGLKSQLTYFKYLCYNQNMKITLDNSNTFFTKKKVIIIILAFLVYGLFLELFVQPCSKLICYNNICTMYSTNGRFSKNTFEYSFNRLDISDYQLQKHKRLRGGPRYRTSSSTSYSLILILKNNQMIHLPYYFGKQQVKDFYQDLKTNNDFIKFDSCYVYRFE